MKAPSLVLIAFNLLFFFLDCETCDTMKCSDYTLPGGSCYYKKDGIIQLKKCPSGQTCDGFLLKDLDLAFCIEHIKKKYVGESCYMDRECHTNFCSASKCARKTPCQSHLDCEKNQYCNPLPNSCKPLEPENGACLFDFQCPVHQFCNKIQCATIHSLETGEKANDHMLCKSGYSRDGMCAEIESTAKYESCTADAECTIKITFNGKAPEKTGNGVCKCGKNGKKFCDITTKNQVWQDYLSRYDYILQKAKSNTDLHVAFERSQYWGDLELAALAKKKDDYPYFKEIDSCAERYLLNAYYLRLSLLSVLALIFVLI